MRGFGSSLSPGRAAGGRRGSGTGATGASAGGVDAQAAVGRPRLRPWRRPCEGPVSHRVRRPAPALGRPRPGARTTGARPAAGDVGPVGLVPEFQPGAGSVFRRRGPGREVGARGAPSDREHCTTRAPHCDTRAERRGLGEGRASRSGCTRKGLTTDSRNLFVHNEGSIVLDF